MFCSALVHYGMFLFAGVGCLLSMQMGSYPDHNSVDDILIWDPVQLGRLTHYAFDAVLCKYLSIHCAVKQRGMMADGCLFLVSAFLAGIKRSTGLT